MTMTADPPDRIPLGDSSPPERISLSPPDRIPLQASPPERISLHAQPATDMRGRPMSPMEVRTRAMADDSLYDKTIKSVSGGNSTLQNFSGGALKETLEFGASGMKGMLGGSITGGQNVFDKQASVARAAEHDVPVQEGAASTTGALAAGGLLHAPEMMVNPASVPGVMATSGAIGGYGSSALDTDEKRASGQNVSGLEEHAKALGHAILGAITGYFGGKAAEMAGQAPRIAERIGANVVAGGATGAAQQAGSNLIEGRPIEEGVRTAGVIGAGQQGIMAGAGELAGSHGERPGTPTTSDTSKALPVDPEANGGVTQGGNRGLAETAGVPPVQSPRTQTTHIPAEQSGSGDSPGFQATSDTGRLASEVHKGQGPFTPPVESALPLPESNTNNPQSVNRKPVYEMSPDELGRQIDVEKNYDKALVNRIFGEEGAKKYNAAWRKANSTFISQEAQDAGSATAEAMENALPKNTQDELFGINQPDRPDIGHMKEIRQSINALDFENETALGRSLRWAITDVGDESDPTKMNYRQQTAFATIRAAMDGIAEHGLNEAKVMEEAVKASASRFHDPEDAEFMLRRFIKPKGSAKDVPDINRQKQIEKATPQLSAPEAVKPENTGEMFGVGPARINDPAFTKPVEGPTSVKNSIVDQQRASRGLPAAMEEQRRSDPKVWDAAMKEIDANPRVQDELIQSLKDKPRPVSDREVALLRHRQLDLENQHDAARQAIVDAYEKGDDAARVQNRVRESAISDELLDVYNVGKTSGRESARGLRARSVLVNQDFTLASMETAKRATNGGKPLTDPQKIELKTQFDKIKAAQDSLKRYTDATAQEASLRKSISDLDARIKTGNLSPRNKVTSTADTKAVADLRQQRADLNRQLDILRRTAGIKGRIEAGDFSQSPRREVKLDPKSQELQARLERYKQSFQDGLIRDRLKNRTTQEKVQDTFIKWRRAFLLSSPITLAKLTSAAAERMAFTPIEEAIGSGIGKAIPGVASRAPREGGLSVRAEAKAITEGFTKGMADAWKTLRTGKSDLDVLYGKHNAIPPEAVDVFGNIHGALKTQAKRGEFARSFQKRTEAAMRGGLDPTDPAAQTRLAVESYKDAQRAIFMQDNRVVSGVKAFIAKIEAKDKVTGEVPLRGKLGATVVRTLLPIIKVPTNIVAETMQYATGLASGGARLARAYAKGIETLKPDEADTIMRSLKKGSVGAATIALGYFGAGSIGGYYQPQKRDDGDVKFGSVRVFGHDVPSYLVHNPLLECLQIGATIRRVSDSYLRKKDSETQGIGSGIAAAALGVIEETPFVRESMELSDLQDPYQRTATGGRFVKGLAIPQAVSFTAEQLDKDGSGDVIKRKPTNFGETLKLGIPGLRKQVPVAKSR